MTRPQPRLSTSLAGAVDLSGLADRARRAPAPDSATPAGDQATSGSPHVIDVTEANFQAEVLERSVRTPVLIDFWAEWCGPCRQLSPALEKLAAEGAGSWVLAKVDVDANPQLSAAFRIQSIPTVMAVVGGQVMEGFQGALPEAQLRQFVAALLQAAGATAGSGTPEPAVDPRLVEADSRLDADDLDGAEALYRQVLAETPGEAFAAAGLAQLELLRRSRELDPGQAIAEADADPENVVAQTRAADVEFLSGRAADAFARLVAAVRRLSGADRDVAREHLLSLFAIAEPDDPAVARARRDLASALY